MTWTVGPVQNMQDIFKSFNGSGFNIFDEHNRALIGFGYNTTAEATKAAELVKDALANAKYVGWWRK
jgi:hypothetical protein